MERERAAMVIPAGHGPIPRVAMLCEAHKDPYGTPPDSPREKKREVKRALGKAGLEREPKGGSTDKHKVVQHTLTLGGGRRH